MIPKADGRERPLGIASLEDKIVQRALVEVLNVIYEAEFLGFSYGFRPGRGQHDALDALATGIITTRVNWIVDADIRSFFDTVDHEWVMRFVEGRIGDTRVLRLIRKWLKAGVLEDGVLSATEIGVPQGSVISPCDDRAIRRRRCLRFRTRGRGQGVSSGARSADGRVRPLTAP
jgi:group II intron reverse transcriptase/maturase